MRQRLVRQLHNGKRIFLGRGSLSVKTDILRDMIIVNLQGVLTPAEYQYARHKKAYLTLNERGRNLWSQDKMI